MEHGHEALSHFFHFCSGNGTNITRNRKISVTFYGTRHCPVLKHRRVLSSAFLSFFIPLPPIFQCRGYLFRHPIFDETALLFQIAPSFPF